MTGVRAIIHQAVVDADLAASYARMRLRIVANRLRSAGASNQELQANRELRAAAVHVECANAVADRIRLLANRLLVEMGEPPIPRPGRGRRPTEGLDE